MIKTGCQNTLLTRIGHIIEDVIAALVLDNGCEPLYFQVVMPEEISTTVETPQSVGQKPTNWSKIVLAAALGISLLVTAAYAGYWYGTESANLPPEADRPLADKSQISKPQPKTQIPETPTPELTPTPTPPVEDETKDWKTYRNGKYGFEVKYPKSWLVYDIDKWESDNEAAPCNQTASPNYLMENTLILSREDLGRCVGFVLWEQWPGEFFLNVKDERWPTSPPYVLGKGEAKLIEISGVAAVKYPFTAKSELPRKQATRVYLNYGSRGYLIEFVQTDKEGNYDPVYDQILSTFKFIE